MRSFTVLAFAAMAAISAFAATPAAANETAARTEAIQLCRAEVAAQAGVEASQIRLDQVRVRARTVRVDLDLWRGGQLTNVRCDVARAAAGATIASISPELTLAAAAR